HGDKQISLKTLKGINTLVLGHDHPAIALRQQSTVHKYKCYLVGKNRGKTIIVQPSTFPLVPGSDVTKEQLRSPVLPKNLSKFEVFIVDEKTTEVLEFGKLKELK
ncbi:MAG: phosphoesterase, partial [Candidatus Woesearchaeota archaeon]|nr:phosphoesterase [Candidatus Woesearchaeota archaeon]